MSNLTILRSYAQKSHPEKLPSSVLLSHTPTSLTIFDAYPKAIFHFLILPRPILATTFDLASLRTLLKSKDKERAKEIILGLDQDAKALRSVIEEEMLKKYGFKWGISIGFHPVPSMEHLHLHVISDDLCSPTLKHKKHYNSFNPKLGFFLHLTEVLEWFNAEPSYFSVMSELKKSQYEPLLKDDLSCWRCGKDMKNMPTLKAHLQEEWDNLAKKEKAKLDKKRKRDEVKETAEESNPKRREIEAPSTPKSETDSTPED